MAGARRLSFRITGISACCAIGIQAASLNSGVPDFDTCEAQGLQLLLNGSFERAHPDGTTPADWGVPPAARAAYQYVTDAQESRHGARFIRCQLDSAHYLWGRLATVPEGKMRAYVWSKGSGELAFVVAMVRKNWRNLPKGKKMLQVQTSPAFRVDSEGWTCFTWDFDASNTFSIDGAAESPEHTQFRIQLKGELAVDACAVVPVSALEKALPQPQPETTVGTSAETGEELDLRPLLTLPFLAEPPSIDGQMAEGEWDSAAAVTGFSELNARTVSTRQTTVFTGFDDEHLYVAFRCPHEGKVQPLPPGRDQRGNHTSEAVEVWLLPPDSQWYQFYLAMGGAITDQSQKEHLSWNPEWRHKDTVHDIPEEIGGILSFRWKLWTVEMAIPFRELGVKAPADAETWRVNFTRDYGAPSGGKRSSSDWTTWSPMRGRFDAVKQFGSATFARTAPAVQWLQIGDLVSGDLSLDAQLGPARETVRFSARTVLSAGGKTVSFRSGELPPADTSQQLSLTDVLKVNAATDLIFGIQAQWVDSRAVLAAMRIPFRATAALRVNAVPVFSRGKLFVNVDASRVADLPEPALIEAAVCRDGHRTDLAVTETWGGGKHRGDLSLAITDLQPDPRGEAAWPPGRYLARVSLRATPDAAPIASSSAGFTVPERPEWLSTPPGSADGSAPPAPWHPVVVTADRVRITEREYVLGPLGLPTQVTSRGKELFTAPPRLSLVVDGKEVTWNARALRPVTKLPERVVWEMEASAPGLKIRGHLSVEFDGFACWDVRLTAEGEAAVDRLALEFPFCKQQALYARGKDATTEDRGSFAALLNADGPAEEQLVAGGHVSTAGWIWPEQWCHEIWVGDDERGLSVMCETQEPLTGAKRIDVVSSESANTLTVYLIDGPCRIRGERAYRYGWQATPVKPRPAEPALWHACYRRRKTIDRLKAGDIKNRLFVTLDMWALKYESYAALRRPRRVFEQANRWLQEQGTKVVPYFGTNLVTTDAAELQPFRSGWEAHPQRIGSNPVGSWAICCPQDPYLADYKVHTLERIINSLGFDGLYLDVSSVSACRNRYHGCGFRSADTEQRQPTVPILANRTLYKRLYRVNKARSPEAVLFRHGMPVAAVAGFVDVVTQGEDWCREGTAQYDRLTPEIFRAREMRIQYGTPYTWYTFHHYHRGEKFGGRVPLSAILAYCLPHAVLPTVGHPGIWPVWDVTDEFWTTAEFIPYWSPESPVSLDREGVLASVFLRRAKQSALLVIANWNRKECSVTATLNPVAMGFTPGKVRLERAILHPMLQPEDAPETDRMPNSPLALDGNTVKLNLHGRNLDVLRLQPQ